MGSSEEYIERGLEQFVKLTLGGMAVAFPHRISALTSDGSASIMSSSGEKAKRRSQRGQCWEEAGGEFYQESYPADTELEALHNDPKHITTMLPSKQACRTACAPTQTRKQSIRRKASTRNRRQSVTARRCSTTNEVHIAALPDLTDESIPNEERTWQEIMQIKSMPISMAKKRELKAKLQNTPKLRLQGLEAWKWQQRKSFNKFTENWKEFFRNFELWNHSLKKIEGHYGTGVVSYFLFIKWLMFLNLVMCSLLILFVVLPDVFFHAKSTPFCTNETYVQCCTEEYIETVEDKPDIGTQDAMHIVQNILQGTGFVEYTQLFYGFYTHDTMTVQHVNLDFNFPLAYLLVMIAFFGMSFVAMIRSAAQGLKENMLEQQGHFYRYSNLIFGGWDFCINNSRSSGFKHKAIYNEIKTNLETERLEDEKKLQGKGEKIQMAFIRLIVTAAVLAVLTGAAAAIYYVTLHSSKISMKDPLLNLLLEYLPSITIVILNLIIPNFFQYIVKFEKYSPSFMIKITLVRTVFLRLANLTVLMVSIYFEIMKCIPAMSSNDCYHCQHLQCWETYVGQQLYKLCLLDFFTIILLTFLVDFPRMLLSKKSCLGKLLGTPEFELPRHALDIVYGQTLCWLGAFFAPVLPLLTVVKCFLFFYVKKFACLVNSAPTSQVYRASRSSSLFMVVLLLSFVFAVVPVGFSIATITPSRSCGPFRNLTTVWQEVVATVSFWPSWLKSIITFFGTAAFAVPVIILLLLSIFYFYSTAVANKHMVNVLKSQLVLEGHDKQFLLNRLNVVIRKHNETLQAQRGDFAPSTSNYENHTAGIVN